jgi:hypothetical protein
MLETDEATVKKVLNSCGPGKFGAELNLMARRSAPTASRPRR